MKLNNGIDSSPYDINFENFVNYKLQIKIILLHLWANIHSKPSMQYSMIVKITRYLFVSLRVALMYDVNSVYIAQYDEIVLYRKKATLN